MMLKPAEAIAHKSSSGEGSRASDAAPSPARRPKALLAEDDPTQRLILQECVESAGFDVIAAADGAEALAFAQQFEPDVILLDVMMPKMTGFEVCAAISHMPKLSGVPILIMTSLDDESAIAQAFDAGATDFLSKPISWRLIYHRLRFIVRIGQMERELRLAKERSDAANVAKANFMAGMSHELRTPLNAIIGFSDVMLGEVHGPLGNPAYKDYLSDIKSSGTHLLGLISDILEWSKLEAGAARFRFETISLKDAVEQCTRMINPLAEEREVSLELDAADLTVSIDLRATRQIVINLLSNAIKFSHAKNKVQVIGRRVDDAFFAIDVKDQGIGIPPDKIGEVTQPFFQVDGGLNRAHGGAGLGLAIASQLAAVLNGRLEIESELGHGTRASVILPIQPKSARSGGSA
jgi:signal transduction histidine kinase